MVKVCPACGAFWFGGEFCHKCGPGFPLIDTASPQAEPWVRKHRVDIRTFYWARSAMLLASIAMLLGLVGGLLLYEYGIRTGGSRLFWGGAMLLVTIVLPWTLFRGITWLFRRQVNKDLKASGRTHATAPDMIDEQKDLLEYK